MNVFDRKFGPAFLATVPTQPAVYYFYDDKNSLVYVGKAKNLRRRLSQYRNATGRGKRVRKMKKLVAETIRISWDLCASDFEACLKELNSIQGLKPRRNIASAFSHRYPLIGMKMEDRNLIFCLTTLPSEFPDFSFYGAFRSRETTGAAFFSLMRVLDFVGHRLPRKELRSKIGRDYSYVFGFRQLPEGWMGKWAEFFKGNSSEALTDLFLKLLENAGARAKRGEMQEGIDSLQQFWEHEAQPLHRVLKLTGHEAYPVSQAERDPLFLKFRHQTKEQGVDT